MKRFYKTVSIILHPIVVPIVTLLLYFIFDKNNFYTSKIKLVILALVFVTTYIIPLLLLLLFKKLKLTKSFNPRSIKERKFPVIVMVIIFYITGNILKYKLHMMEFAILFYATTLSLILIYIYFYFKIKASTHLMSLGISTSIFIIFGIIYSEKYILIVIGYILCSGILANARLHLETHTSKEVYLGYLFGFISPFLVYYLL